MNLKTADTLTHCLSLGVFASGCRGDLFGAVFSHYHLLPEPCDPGERYSCLPLAPDQWRKCCRGNMWRLWSRTKGAAGAAVQPSVTTYQGHRAAEATKWNPQKSLIGQLRVFSSACFRCQDRLLRVTLLLLLCDDCASQ